MLTNSCSDGQQPQSRLLDWKPTSNLASDIRIYVEAYFQ
jgi:hypothetical protein